MKTELLILIASIAAITVVNGIRGNTPKFNKFKDLKNGIVRFKLNNKIMDGILCDKRGGLFKPMEYNTLLRNNKTIWINAKDLLIKQYF